MNVISDWISPPTSAWWYIPLASTLLIALTCGLFVSFWPLRLNGPVLATEQRKAHGSPWGRWIGPLVRVTFLSVGLFVSLALLTLGPRRPYTLLYQAGEDAPDPAYWNDRVPAEHSRRQRLDPDPLIRSVLQTAASEGAARWQVPDPTSRQRLGELCLDALLGRLPPVQRMIDSDPLPAWIRGSVEMTIIQGIIIRENARWAAIRCPAASPPWKRAERFLAHPGVPVVLFADSEPESVRVLALFDGSSTSTGQVSAQALVNGAVGATAELTFPILSSDQTEPIASIRKQVTLTQTFQRIPIQDTIVLFPDSRAEFIRNEQGTVQATLTQSDAPPIKVAVHGSRSEQLVRALQAILDADGLRTRLGDQGLPTVKWESTVPGPKDVSVELRSDEILVLAAGISPQAIASPGSGTDPGLGSIRSHGRRMSYVGDQAATDLSWMSVSLRGASGDLLPQFDEYAQTQSGGVLMNQPLAAGRSLSLAETPLPFPLMEVLLGGKVVRFRLDAERQGFLADLAKLPDAWEPARARAFVTSLLWAVERVRYRELTSSNEISEPTPLLSSSTQQTLSDLGRHDSDGIALILAGGCLLALLQQAYSSTKRR